MLFCFLVLMANCLSFIFHAQVGSEAKGHHLNLMTLSYLKEKMELAGLSILEMNGEPDHVHILFEAPPNMDLAKMVNALKTGSSRMTRKHFADELAPYYWKPVFWSMSYFICTVSDRNAETVKRYIQDQDIK